MLVILLFINERLQQTITTIEHTFEKSFRVFFSFGKLNSYKKKIKCGTEDLNNIPKLLSYVHFTNHYTGRIAVIKQLIIITRHRVSTIWT